MNPLRSAFLLALCAPADSDTPPPTTAGGSTPSTAEPSPAPPSAPGAEAPPLPAPAPAAKAGVIDSAIAMFKGKGAMAAELSTLKAQIATLTGENTALKSQLATITGERDNLQSGFARLESALASANAERTTVEQAVTHELATLGVPESKLPKGTPPAAVAEGSVEERIAALNKQIEDPATDPRERGRLSNQVWDLMKQNASKVTVAAN